MRLISQERFKKIVIKDMRKFSNYSFLMDTVKGYILKNLNNNVLDKVKSHTDESTINVLVTASPADYVCNVAESLGWNYICSDLSNGEFTHVHRSNKLKLLEEKYPSSNYFYNYAVSDSQTDMPLLKLFSNYDFIN